MRDIKFRAWSKEQNTMINDIHLNNDAGEYSSYFGDYLNDTGYAVMQYTGLKDKNGKDIYEGDIVILNVLIEPFRNRGTYWTNKKFVVEFKEQCYRPERLGESEIIGNIYENPELIEQKLTS